jgi:hypothetical protein
MDDAPNIGERYRLLGHLLDERCRRLWAAAEAACIGYGGVSLVSRETGLSRETIEEGIRNLKEPWGLPDGRVRRKGGGRRRTVLMDPTLEEDLDALIEPLSGRHPDSPLRWTCMSVRTLAAELTSMGHKTSHRMVAELLHKMDYCLHGNKKTLERGSHSERNAQFEYINREVHDRLSKGEPAISVDTKRTALSHALGNAAEGRRAKPDRDGVPAQGIAMSVPARHAPRGMDTVAREQRQESLGADGDTTVLAAETVRRWWYLMGESAYPNARALLIATDSGRGAGATGRQWRRELQRLAHETGLELSVCHFPAGTCKWNRIEHRLTSLMTQDWGTRSSIAHEVTVALIGQTPVEQKPGAHRDPDRRTRHKRVKDRDAHVSGIATLDYESGRDWNYTIHPGGIHSERH